MPRLRPPRRLREADPNEGHARSEHSSSAFPSADRSAACTDPDRARPHRTPPDAESTPPTTKRPDRGGGPLRIGFGDAAPLGSGGPAAPGSTHEMNCLWRRRRSEACRSNSPTSHLGCGEAGCRRPIGSSPTRNWPSDSTTKLPRRHRSHCALLLSGPRHPARILTHMVRHDDPACSCAWKVHAHRGTRRIPPTDSKRRTPQDEEVTRVRNRPSRQTDPFHVKLARARSLRPGILAARPTEDPDRRPHIARSQNLRPTPQPGFSSWAITGLRGVESGR